MFFTICTSSSIKNNNHYSKIFSPSSLHNNSVSNKVVSEQSRFLKKMANRVIEKKNRTIINMAKSMLMSKKMTEEFWAEVVACAVYLSNRSPTRSVHGKTPQEAWSGRKRKISHLNCLSIAYVHVPDEKRSKLNDKSEKYIFIGYDSS